LELNERFIAHPGHPALKVRFTNSAKSRVDVQSRIADLKFKISNDKGQIMKGDGDSAIIRVECQI
jgi:hypothetical protein